MSLDQMQFLMSVLQEFLVDSFKLLIGLVIISIPFVVIVGLLYCVLDELSISAYDFLKGVDKKIEPKRKTRDYS